VNRQHRHHFINLDILNRQKCSRAQCCSTRLEENVSIHQPPRLDPFQTRGTSCHALGIGAKSFGSARQTPIRGRSDPRARCQHLPRKCHATLSIMPANRIRRLGMWLADGPEIKEVGRAVLFREQCRVPRHLSPRHSNSICYHGCRTNHPGRLPAEEWRHGRQRQYRLQHDPALT